MRIFVSVAAYRDPDLLPTLADCVAKARWRGALRLVVCWQHEPGEPRPRLPGRRVEVLAIPWRESRGACAARAALMARYDGEDFFLQLDSHHRFREGWDAILLDQLERTGVAKPLLTTYGTPFQPDAPLPAAGPTGMEFAGFLGNGLPAVQLVARPGWGGRDRPVRARFLSAHLLFAPGRFVAEVPYDPALYFYGEEITLAVRAFTHGWDLFHPAAHVLWHQEPRRLRPLHWNDHVPGAGPVLDAARLDAASLARAAALLAGGAIGSHGLGSERSLADYQAYAGLDFLRRRATAAARADREPDPPAPPRSQLRCWPVRIDLDPAALPAAAFDRARFWYVGVHDDAGEELARADAGREEIAAARAGRALDRMVTGIRPPKRWTVWPVDRRGRWLDKLTGPVAPAG